MEVKVQLTPLTITEITEKQQVMRRASSASSEALCSIDLNPKVSGDEGSQNGGGGVGEATKTVNEGETKVVLASGQRKRRKAQVYTGKMQRTRGSVNHFCIPLGQNIVLLFPNEYRSLFPCSDERQILQ